jgi:three-Cys-motif partner protein
MAAPTSVTWSLPEHTLVKHQILEHYLQAWLPIMAGRSGAARGPGHLVLVDGFAGPGRFGGNEGSPLVIIRTYMEHAAAALANTRLTFVLIEPNAARFSCLQSEISAIEPRLPANATVLLIPASFADVMSDRARFMGADAAQAPSFVFIDPFGYKSTKLNEISNLLSFGHSEAFIYVPLWHIARFLDKVELADTFSKVYGDDRWKAARSELGWPARHDRLRELFHESLAEHVTYVRWFEMRGRNANTGYHLFFGSNSPEGLRKMKAAMWLADPYEGSVFRDPRSTGQTLLLQTPCYETLLHQLYGRFGQTEFSIDDAARFTLTETAFRDDAHLKKPTLGAAERAGCVVARRPGSRTVPGEYPAGTMLRFTGELRLAAPGVQTVSEPEPAPSQIALW